VNGYAPGICLELQVTSSSNITSEGDEGYLELRYELLDPSLLDPSPDRKVLNSLVLSGRRALQISSRRDEQVDAGVTLRCLVQDTTRFTFS